MEKTEDTSPFGGLNPLNLLRQAMRVAPATRWAMGVVGLASAAAIIMALFRSPVFGLVGIAGVFIAMIALFIFSRILKFASRATRLPALMFMWFSGLMAMATIALVFWSTFFNSPWPLRDRLFSQAVSLQAQKAGLPEVAAATRGLSEDALIKLVELNRAINHVGYFEADTGTYIVAQIPQSVRELDQRGLVNWSVRGKIMPKSEFAEVLARLGLRPPWQVPENTPQSLPASANISPSDKETLREFSYQMNERGLALYGLVIQTVLRQIREV